MVKTIPNTNNGEMMTTTSLGKKNKARQLTGNDRCDACGSQAYVWVNGVSGDLLFCSHHYTKIMNDKNGKSAMEAFAFETVDDRDNLSTKRAGL
jgi:hypothetical protein